MAELGSSPATDLHARPQSQSRLEPALACRRGWVAVCRRKQAVEEQLTGLRSDYDRIVDLHQRGRLLAAGQADARLGGESMVSLHLV